MDSAKVEIVAKKYLICIITKVIRLMKSRKW